MFLRLFWKVSGAKEWKGTSLLMTSLWRKGSVETHRPVSNLTLSFFFILIRALDFLFSFSSSDEPHLIHLAAPKLAPHGETKNMVVIATRL